MSADIPSSAPSLSPTSPTTMSAPPGAQMALAPNNIAKSSNNMKGRWTLVGHVNKPCAKHSPPDFCFGPPCWMMASAGIALDSGCCPEC